jgi:ribosomal protein L40E
MSRGLGWILVPSATLVAAVAAGAIQGPAFAVLALAAGALLAAVALLWTSIRAVFGETPLTGEEAYALGAPTAEEEQKRAVLQALKDIDFEHSVGKLSDADHRELSLRYRSEAKCLLRLLDERAQPERERVEKLVLARLRREGLIEQQGTRNKEQGTENVGEEGSSTATEAAPDAATEAAPDAATAPTCPKCDAPNDADAAFCKKCGTRLGAEEQA